MTVENIISLRELERWPSFHLVYEWEDLFGQELGLRWIMESRRSRFLNKITRNTGIPLYRYGGGGRGCSLLFEMTAKTKGDNCNRANIIPYIIDFYLTEEQLPAFYAAHRKNPFVIVSSLEAVAFLRRNHCPLKLVHIPLSLSDAYRMEGNAPFRKRWDLVLMGRQNPVLEKFLHRYASLHPEFTYVYRELVEGNFIYKTNKGEVLGEYGSRADYIALMRESRIGFYSTPGIDGGESFTKGFNQVTPRFLELIACGCHIIARYRENEDTDFYRLSEFCKSVEQYAEFEAMMEDALSREVDLEKYGAYMADHYTSKRVALLNEKLKEI